MTLTIKQACGHDWTGPTPATAEETAAAVNTWRAKACDNDDCRPYAVEFRASQNHTDEEWKAGKYAPVRVLTGLGTYKAPASHGARFYHGGSHVANGCTIIQVDGDNPTYQARILERAGATLLTGSVRAHLKPYLRSGVSTTTTLMLASTWIDGNVERDHTRHTCPDCAKDQERCADLACSTPVNKYRCSACSEAWYAHHRETADERRHTLHACTECGDVTTIWGNENCTREVDDPVHIYGRCGKCGASAPRYPVSIMADRPLEHCAESECPIIVERKGDRCRYHPAGATSIPREIVRTECDEDIPDLGDPAWVGEEAAYAAARDASPAHVKEDAEAHADMEAAFVELAQAIDRSMTRDEAEAAWPPAVRAAAYAEYTAWPPAARAVGYRA